MMPPTADNRAPFLARVRARLGQPPLSPMQPDPGAPQPDLVAAALPNLVVAFMAAAQAAACTCVVVPDGAVALEQVIVYAQQHAIASVILSGWQPLADLGTIGLDEVRRALDASGIAVHGWPTDGRRLADVAALADASLTGVAFALADTGTLVSVVSPTSGRTPSLVPPVHIAVCDARQLLPDLTTLYRTMAAWHAHQILPSHVVLSTGTSRSADIEGTLVRGVHGPGAVHIVIILSASAGHPPA